jgi:hypothetical protein
MTVTPFDKTKHLVRISARLWGPMGDYEATLALDTGCYRTSIATKILVYLGFDPDQSKDIVRVTMGSGIVEVKRLEIDGIETLGETREPFLVVSHTLPPTASVDGVLGLDFFQDRNLQIDFREGKITLG